MKLPLVISMLTVGLAVLPAPGWATSAHLDALDSIGRVTVDVMVGDSVGSAHRKTLFFGDRVRKEALEERLKLTAETLLGAAGIESGPEAEDYFSIGIWGHQDEQASDGILAVYWIEVAAVDHEYNPDASCDDQRDLTTKLRAVGVAGLGDLEKVLESEVVRLIEEMVPR